MNLEVARRMEENKDLSEKRVKILQEKRDRLKEEARAQEDYHMSVHQVPLKQRVENFSKRNRWIVATQVRESNLSILLNHNCCLSVCLSVVKVR